MDENNRTFFTNFLNSTHSPKEYLASQNSQIPPNDQYPHPFPNVQFPPQILQNFQGFGNFINYPNYAPRGPYQPFPAEY